MESGELSRVSVFHKYAVFVPASGTPALIACCRFVVIAPTRDMVRKVFNSPSFVNPTVIDVSPKLLRPTNWVFLDGKAHVEYRKGLNGLLTRQVLDM